MTRELVLNFGQEENVIFRIKPLDEAVCLTITDSTKKRKSEINFDLTKTELEELIMELKDFL